MTYEIFEGNMERLEKKLTRIYNKCQKYGCYFHFAQVGETFKEVEDEHGRKRMAKFIIVEAEGTAIINDWEFVAAVEHTKNGNIFSGVQGIEVPKMYYHADPVCEHCNTKRVRKYTYIVRNKTTNEFKQVGKACLCDYTHGMSAEAIAQYVSLFDELIQGQTPYQTAPWEDYIIRDEYLAYVAETIRCFGFVKSADDRFQATARRALDYYDVDHGAAMTGQYMEELRDEMEAAGIDPKSDRVKQLVKDALEWVASQHEDGNNYMHNLKTACSLEYVALKNVGLVASLFPAYERAKERMARYSYADESKSEHAGWIGEKLFITVRSAKCMASWDTEYGPKRLYKFIGEDGNVYTWRTGVTVPDDMEGKTLSGLVKAHTEFRGVKQTELTRCFISDPA